MAVSELLKFIIRGQDQTKGAFRSVNRNVKKTSNNFRILKRVAGAALSVFVARAAVRGISQLNDTMVNMKNKLRLVTDGTADLAVSQNGSTTGGLIGDTMTFTAISGTIWVCTQAVNVGSGTNLTPFTT